MRQLDERAFAGGDLHLKGKLLKQVQAFQAGTYDTCLAHRMETGFGICQRHISEETPSSI